jgi:DNA-binding beta-propeller fold protein YncE
MVQRKLWRGIALIGVLAAGTCVLGDVELFIADRDNDSVLRFDADTGAFIDEFVTSGAGGLGNPVNVAFGPDGNLYVADFSDGNVMRFDGRTGAFIDIFASYSWLEETVEILFREDYLYALSNDQNLVAVFDAHTGNFDREFGDPLIRYPHDMCFGPDGLLYVTTESSTYGRVQSWDVSRDQLVAGFGEELGIPTGIAFGPDGHIYVADWWTNRVVRYDGTTHDYMGEFIPPDTGGLAGPSSVDFRPNGYLYVSGTNGVHRYDANTGAFIDFFIPDGTGGLGGARGMAFRYPRGDMNCDGLVTAADIDPFVTALTGGQVAYEQAHPYCSYYGADLNGDGEVSAADIDPFVVALTGG